MLVIIPGSIYSLRNAPIPNWCYHNTWTKSITVRTYSTPAHTAIDMHAYLCTHMHEQHEQQDPQDRVSQLALPLSLPNDSYYLLVLRYRRICRTSTVYIRTVESGFYVWWAYGTRSRAIRHWLMYTYTVWAVHSGASLAVEGGLERAQSSKKPTN